MYVIYIRDIMYSRNNLVACTLCGTVYLAITWVEIREPKAITHYF